MNKKRTNWFGQAKRRATKMRPNAIVGGIFGRFSNLDKCRSEVAGDVTVISGVTVDQVDTDACATCGGSGLTVAEIFDSLSVHTRLSITFCSI